MDERTRAKSAGFDDAAARPGRACSRRSRRYAAERGSHLRDGHGHHSRPRPSPSWPRPSRPRSSSPRSRPSPRPRPQALSTDPCPRSPSSCKHPTSSPTARSNTGTDFVHTFDSGKPGPARAGERAHPRQRDLRRHRGRPAAAPRAAARRAGTLTLAFANVDGVPALRSGQSLRDALRRRGLQPRLDAGGARRPARQRRAAPGARSCGPSSRRPTSCSTSTRCSSPARR